MIFLDRKRRLYQLVVAAGGGVPDQASWRELGQRAGYSARSDLAGFFGGRYPSMRQIGDRRELTADGWRRAL